ncbi:AarF/ABC1/UbiB kinase family protein [uncultured Limosilactobacillus sp.]|uniref:ABC1 kinase family protein n=1 Tax=uncultured Limosilactobacillus sp. TaxID=2837629 RepID=UPI0025D52DD5|nr:AarF/UbiB family protein [uncultured Limosilactobacillus sp.]
MTKPISQAERIKEIMSVLRRHSFISNFYHQTNPDEVLATFHELGPTFIKLGQMLSTRPDLVSPEYIKALRTLQDKVPADDYQTVAKVFLDETGKTIDQTFKTFAKHPFASASVGQCHYATLPNGTKVVVKIQHPAVSRLIKVDLALFKKAVRLIKYVPGDFSVVDFNAVMDQLAASILSEVNTMHEAENGEKFYQLNHGDGIIEVPRVFIKECHPKILVNEAMPGKSIKYLMSKPVPDDHEQAQQLKELQKNVAQILVKNFIKQVFEDRFFHADPHPGNILFYQVPDDQTIPDHEYDKTFGKTEVHFSTHHVLPPYRLVYLDFGMMGTLSKAMADGIAKIVLALPTKDNYQISQAVLNVCNRTGEVDEQKFIREFSRFLQPYLNAQLATLDIPNFIYSITQLCHDNHLQLRPEVTLLFKAFGTLEGTIARLDPSLSMMEVAKPFAWHYFKEHFDIKNSFIEHAGTAYNGIKATAQLPQKLTRTLDQVTSGEARINLHYVGQKKVLNQFNKLLNRLLVVIMLASLILSSSILVVGSRDRFIYRLGVTGWLIAIIVALFLVISTLHQRWKNKH